jgi:hypothetical protein
MAFVLTIGFTLVFDHSDATRDFGFKPRSFILTEKDIST